ncbi:MAG: nucleotidyltransferase family protein, partial [Prochlorococcaceae cyanobacterium]
IALCGDAVQNGAMAAPSTQETSLSQRLLGAREQVLAVAHRHGARNLRIYGSVARGQDRPGSDLDLLVDLERDCSLLEVIALRQELAALLNCQVDLAEAAQLHPLIRDQIIAQATAL